MRHFTLRSFSLEFGPELRLDEQDARQVLLRAADFEEAEGRIGEGDENQMMSDE